MIDRLEHSSQELVHSHEVNSIGPGSQLEGFLAIPRTKLKENTFLENLTFSYLNKVISRGNSMAYTKELLFDVGENFKFKAAHERLLEILGQTSGKLSYWTIILYDFQYFIRLTALNLLNNGISLLAAIFTSSLIDWIQEKEPGAMKGARLTFLVAFVMILKAFSYNWYSILSYENMKYILNGLRVSFLTFLVLLKFN